MKGTVDEIMEHINVWNTYDLSMQRECDKFAGAYIGFLNECKTERECVDRIVNDAENAGFIELSGAIAEGRKLKAGDRVYSVWMNKSVVLFRIGEEPMEQGINILGAHIDSPRLDIKADPLLTAPSGYLTIRFTSDVLHSEITLSLSGLSKGMLSKKPSSTA